MKDTMVVTAKQSGAEVIPVLKGWIVLPVALVVTLIYTKLSNHFRRDVLFYTIVSSFLAFILLYAYFLFPYNSVLAPNETADQLQAYLGDGHTHWVSLYRNWIPSVFFVVAELWGSIGIGLLFWGFANQIIKVSEAKRFYTLFIAGGDLGAILTGPLVWYYVQKYANFGGYTTIMQSLLLYAAAFFGLILVIYWWIQKKVVTDKRFYNPDPGQNLTEKTKLSLRKSLKYIAKSKYLRCIAIMVLAYGLTINLVEVTWKANLKMLYPNPTDYQSFMGILTSCVGLGSFIVALFFGSSVIRFFGWHKSAQITPATVGISGILFFTLILGQNYYGNTLIWAGITPLVLIVGFGAIQNILSKVVKYSFFDPTKEMAYIPLDDESKIKGKAAIDIVGSRLGKSGSAWIQIALIDLIGTGSIFSITPYITPLIGVIVVLWIFSVRSLNTQFEEKHLEQEQKLGIQDPVNE